MSFSFATPRPRRRPSLTPMVDVVFLLLVFFMLAARFGQEAHITLNLGSSGAGDWSGPPRLVEIAPDALRLNGVPVAPGDLAPRLQPLIADPDDPILLLPEGASDLQRLLEIMAVLTEAGFTNLILGATP